MTDNLFQVVDVAQFVDPCNPVTYNLQTVEKWGALPTMKSAISIGKRALRLCWLADRPL